MTTVSSLSAIGARLHRCLITRDWEGMGALLTPDVTWRLPGNNQISAAAIGRDAVVSKAMEIASYGVSFTLEHILVSADNVALSIHNLADNGERRLDEHLATVCTVRGGRIAAIETYLSDVEGMNAYFV